MASPTGRGLLLSPEAGTAVWRIFGQGAAPRAKRLTYEQIEPVIREHVPSGDQHRAFTTVRGWFELGGPTPSLKPECRELVADLILDGVGPRRSDPAVWAIGSIEPPTFRGPDQSAVVLGRDRIIHRRGDPSPKRGFQDQWSVRKSRS